MSTSDDFDSSINLSELSEDETVRFGVDLVSAARRNLGFLKLVSDSDWLHQKHTVIESIRRYDELWMPLISDLTVGLSLPMILPPLDVEWVWYCHTINPVKYRTYCESRFGKLIGKRAIFDEENEDYALDRCRVIWEQRHPSEPFEIDLDLSSTKTYVANEGILNDVLKQRYLYTNFDEPYRTEIMYLIAARQRYKGFHYIIDRVSDKCSRLVPTSDIMLMWLTHMSYPTVYSIDCKELEGQIGRVYLGWDSVNQEEIEATKNLWEDTFHRPYEKAGGAVIGKELDFKPPIYWPVCDADVNTKYKSMVPRFLLEFCVSVRVNNIAETKKRDLPKEFLRLRVARCHKDLKLDKPLINFRTGTWEKAWHLYCEFGTKGVILEIRRQGSGILKGSSPLGNATFYWNDLLRAPSLTLATQLDLDVRADASITPPVQASYLLKCVPDRVTDDSGAMISDLILQMNQYRPQEGRWLSRTVLDHAGKECFVIRMRMGGGFWRRGAEAPSPVNWKDRIIEIRDGSWSYVEGSVGRAPEKVVGTATPNETPEGWQASWNLSTGNELLIGWRSETSSLSSMSFKLKSNNEIDKMTCLLKGRKMQYQTNPSNAETSEKEHEGDGFITVIRFSDENPKGKATALLNWKLLTVELLPEEDAVFVLLLCMAVVRSMSEFKKEDVGSLLVRRRIKQGKSGERDWGSVILHPSSNSSSHCSPYLQPWYWNAKMVMASQTSDHMMQPTTMNSNYSPSEGGDKLYKRSLFA